MNGTRWETIATADTDLRVAVTGEGPPVVLLHGFPENADSWRHQVGPLAAAGFSVWTPDLRGYRHSGMPANREAYRLPALVADIAAVARATGHARIHLAGHDWGGVVAWAFAHTHPELLNRLMILNAPHLAIYRHKLFRSRQWLRSWYIGVFLLPWLPEKILAANDFRALRAMFKMPSMRMHAFSEERIGAYAAAMSPPGRLSAALNYYRANLGWITPWRPAAAPIAARTLIIWGERDPALGVGLLDGIERHAPHMKIARIADASHWVQNEAPEEVNHLMTGFLLEP